jgi:2-polyprenyl-3-methyl-5-hydroxy-6-metoxy-1,4-benzoquinol methylase
MRAVPCPTCCSCGAPGNPLYLDLRDKLFGAAGIWSLRKCSAPGCGLLWLDPMPLAVDLPLAYQTYYTHGEKSASGLRAVGKSLLALVNDGLLWVGGIPPERQRSRLMFLADRPPGTLLDVGCGDGTFLAAMARRGWQVSGIDFDPVAVEAARTVLGLDVHVATIESVAARGQTFDVVTASHVIEHVPDPIEFLSHCRRLLRPGGRLVLKTPNADSFGSRLYGRAWRGLEPPRHLHIFTLEALERSARKAGFTNCNVFTTSVGAEHILTASRLLATKRASGPDGPSRLAFLQSRVLRPVLALRAKFAWLRDRSSGEEICAVLSNVPTDTKR